MAFVTGLFVGLLVERLCDVQSFIWFSSLVNLLPCRLHNWSRDLRFGGVVFVVSC